jgi:peroxiredoxin
MKKLLPLLVLLVLAPAAAAAAPRLAPGDPAPAFDVRDAQGKRVTLAGFKGKKLLLSFHRYAACVFCNLRVHDEIERYAAWRRDGLDVVAFFESPPESVRAYVGKQQPPFALVPDPDREVYARYGVVETGGNMLAVLGRTGEILRGQRLGLLATKQEGEFNLLPADFLIGPDGRVHTAYYGNDIGDHLSFEAIDRFVAEGRPAPPRPAGCRPLSW